MVENLKVLVVDDEEALRKILALRFEQEGFDVVTAGNGVDAVKLAEEERPHAVVLDIIMPGMHGFEVVKQIRSIPSLSKTVVVMTSAKSYKADIDAAKKLGADDYCVKPTDFEDLLSRIRKHLKHRAGIA